MRQKKIIIFPLIYLDYGASTESFVLITRQTKSADRPRYGSERVRVWKDLVPDIFGHLESWRSRQPLGRTRSSLISIPNWIVLFDQIKDFLAYRSSGIGSASRTLEALETDIFFFRHDSLQIILCDYTTLNNQILLVVDKVSTHNKYLD